MLNAQGLVGIQISKGDFWATEYVALLGGKQYANGEQSPKVLCHVCQTCPQWASECGEAQQVWAGLFSC